MDDGAMLIHFEVTATNPKSPFAIGVEGGQIVTFDERLIKTVIQTRFPPDGWDEARAIFKRAP